MKKQNVCLLALTLIGVLVLPQIMSAQVRIPNPLTADTFCQLFTSIANAVAGLIGALGTIMIIVAGILYLTSAGSPERMGKAKTALIYAIAGIAIAISAGAIVAVIKEVLNAAGGGC